MLESRQFSLESKQTSSNNAKHSPSKRKRRTDYAKFKVPLDNPWFLVFLKSGKHFVHNCETKQSLWIAPQGVQEQIDRLDRDQLILLIAKSRGLKLDQDKKLHGKETEFYDTEDDLTNTGFHETENKLSGVQSEAQELQSKDSDKQLGQNIAESSESLSQPQLKTDALTTNVNEQTSYNNSSWEPLEEPDDFEDENSPLSSSGSELADNESAFDYNLDISDDEEQLSQEQKLAIFKEMLDSYNIDPYKPWESELNLVLDDARYDVFDTNKQRSEAFDLWAKQKIANMKQEELTMKAQQTDSQDDQFANPVSSFINYIKTNYNKRLLYIDFKRKHRKDSQFTDSELSDKDKEKLFRQFSTWMKKSEKDREIAFEQLALRVEWQDILDEPLYHTLSFDTVKNIHDSIRKNSATSQEQGIKKRQHEVEKQKQKQRQELRRERYHLQKENAKVEQATYNIDAKVSLRDHLKH